MGRCAAAAQNHPRRGRGAWTRGVALRSVPAAISSESPAPQGHSRPPDRSTGGGGASAAYTPGTRCTEVGSHSESCQNGVPRTDAENEAEAEAEGFGRADAEEVAPPEIPGFHQEYEVPVSTSKEVQTCLASPYPRRNTAECAPGRRTAASAIARCAGSTAHVRSNV